MARVKLRCIVGCPGLKSYRQKGHYARLYTTKKNSLIFLKDFVHFKNICFNNTFASDQFKTKKVNYKKQIFHAFFFNTINYSPDVINIQRREAELNITLPRMNNFDTKQKKAWNICFIICHQHQTRSSKIKTKKTQQTSVKTQVLSRKN